LGKTSFNFINNNKKPASFTIPVLQIYMREILLSV